MLLPPEQVNFNLKKWCLSLSLSSSAVDDVVVDVVVQLRLDPGDPLMEVGTDSSFTVVLEHSLRRSLRSWGNSYKLDPSSGFVPVPAFVRKENTKMGTWTQEVAMRRAAVMSRSIRSWPLPVLFWCLLKSSHRLLDHDVLDEDQQARLTPCTPAA